MTLDPADVLARAAEWVWLPEDAREMPTPEYRVVAFPPHFAEPTEAFPRGSSSERPAPLVVDDVLAAAAVLGRDAVTIMGLSEATCPPDLEAHLVDRGAELRETLAVLARPLGGVPPALDVPPDVEVRQVLDLDTLRELDRIDMAVFGGTPQSEERLAATAAGLAEDSSTPRFVAYRDGAPAGSAGCTVAGEVLRLWGGACLPDARGRGVYRALLDHRLRVGAGAGCRMALVKGRVETSAPILRRAGFAAYGEERAYRVTVA